MKLSPCYDEVYNSLFLFLLAINQVLALQGRYGVCSQGVFSFMRNNNQQFKTFSNWVSFITALDVPAPQSSRNPFEGQNLSCVSPRALIVVS